MTASPLQFDNTLLFGYNSKRDNLSGTRFPGVSKIRTKNIDLMNKISDFIGNYYRNEHVSPTVRAIADQQECAHRNAYEVVPLMERLRAEIDALEIVVSAKHWPVPSYNDILFYA